MIEKLRSDIELLSKRLFIDSSNRFVRIRSLENSIPSNIIGGIYKNTFVLTEQSKAICRVKLTYRTCRINHRVLVMIL